MKEKPEIIVIVTDGSGTWVESCPFLPDGIDCNPHINDCNHCRFKDEIMNSESDMRDSENFRESKLIIVMAAVSILIPIVSMLWKG